MGEIGWLRAFGYAFRYVIYVIFWLIIGGIIFVIGLFTIMGSTRIRYEYEFGEPPRVETEVNFGAMIWGFIVAIIGLVIMNLAALAVYFKLMSRLVSESIPEIPKQ